MPAVKRTSSKEAHHHTSVRLHMHDQREVHPETKQMQKGNRVFVHCGLLLGTYHRLLRLNHVSAVLMGQLDTTAQMPLSSRSTAALTLPPEACSAWMLDSRSKKPISCVVKEGLLLVVGAWQATCLQISKCPASTVKPWTQVDQIPEKSTHLQLLQLCGKGGLWVCDRRRQTQATQTTTHATTTQAPQCSHHRAEVQTTGCTSPSRNPRCCACTPCTPHHTRQHGCQIGRCTSTSTHRLSGWMMRKGRFDINGKVGGSAKVGWKRSTSCGHS